MLLDQDIPRESLSGDLAVRNAVIDNCLAKCVSQSIIQLSVIN